MEEREFVSLLQKRVKEQHDLIEELPFPRVFAVITRWLSDHPWRYLIPLAFLLTLLMRNIIGSNFTDLVLRFFYGGI